MLNDNKSPKATLEDKKFIFVLMGFIVALSVLYIGFEWTAKEVTIHVLEDTLDWEEDEMDIIQTQEPPPPPPPPPPPEQFFDEIIIVDDEEEVESIIIIAEDDPRDIIDIPVRQVIEIEEDDAHVIFEAVEHMPSFPGGHAAMMRWLNEHIRYPQIAIENNIQGRVMVQFVVNTDGSIVDVVVIRGQDPLLDREALRVVGQMPSWTPGKQGTRPVRVRFTIPVIFRLE